MASTADFRNGLVMELDGQMMRIVEFLHVKPGKGGAFVRTKLKNVETGAVIERTFRAGEKVSEVRLERRNVQYLYNDGDIYHFMDTETYDQLQLSADRVGEARDYLRENDTVQILMRGDTPIMVELPTHVVLTVKETEPGVRGDTASGANKPATMETGLVVTVPLFIEVGDELKIDTRSGEYIERTSK
ncbi:MAG: elongation factor P [Candidatus Eisenbacteria bacterium]|nr:elongation factor P [Candidatus Eisenbacteria bacterium]